MCGQNQQHAVAAEITRFQWAVNAETSVAAGGGFLEWNTEVLRPGRHPGMNSATTEVLLIHTLRCHQAPHRRNRARGLCLTRPQQHRRLRPRRSQGHGLGT